MENEAADKELADTKEYSLEDLADEALFIQDACNLTALANGFGRAMTRLRHLISTGEGGISTLGYSDARTHPITKLWMSKLVDMIGDPNRFPDDEERAELREEGFVSELDKALTLVKAMSGKFQQTDFVKVLAHRSEPGQGLSYGEFFGTVMSDGKVGGWDVYDVMASGPDGELQAVYGFSITLDTRGRK